MTQRTLQMACSTCIYWGQQEQPDASTYFQGDDPSLGTCQLQPPLMAIDGRGVFPLVHASRFCSQWQGDEDEGDDRDPDEAPVADGSAAPGPTLRVVA